MSQGPDVESPASALEPSAPLTAPAPAPAQDPAAAEARRKRWIVEAFGREWPKSTNPERLFWALIMLGCYVCVGLAAFVLDPDVRGLGTHEQLGLPPCGFIDMVGGPCPSCGFTTTFTLAAHLRPIDALVNQPFGFFVFVLSLAAMAVLPPVVTKNVSLFALTDRWPWIRIGLGLLAAWLIAWAYKWHMQVGLF